MGHSCRFVGDCVKVLINCLEENDAVLPGQFPDALGVYMEMVVAILRQAGGSHGPPLYRALRTRVENEPHPICPYGSDDLRRLAFKNRGLKPPPLPS
jgi:hypothetical protein